jgi:hypothetical protein
LGILALPVSLLHLGLLGGWNTAAQAAAPASPTTPPAVLTSVITPPPQALPTPATTPPPATVIKRPKPVHRVTTPATPTPSAPAASPNPAVISAAAAAVLPASAASPAAPAPAVALLSPVVSPAPQVATTPATTPATPIYATRIPPPQRVKFKWRRGFLSGDATLDWQHDGQHYDMSIKVDAVLIGSVMVQSSRGRFDSAGLAPERHTDRRRGVSERALSVQRNTTPAQLSFSSTTEVQPFASGSQDKLSWMLQTAAILEARAAGQGGHSAHANTIDLIVAGVGGSVESWHIRTDPAEGLVRLVRAPSTPFETRTDIWLDPAQHHMPVRIRLTDPGGDPLELTQVTDE